MRPNPASATSASGIVGLVLASATCLAPSTSSAQQARTALDDVPPSVVRVMVEGADGRIGIGSGVPITRQTVVTNCHVTRGAKSMDVVVGEGVDAGRFPVAQQAADPARDLCVLRTKGYLPVKAASIGPAPKVGDPVLALGFSGGSDVRAHPGKIDAAYPLDGGEVLMTGTAFSHGSSGGGLFNTANELVGILTFHGSEGSGQFYSVPATWIAAVLADRPFQRISAHAGDGRAFWEEELDKQPAFLRSNAMQAAR